MAKDQYVHFRCDSNLKEFLINYSQKNQMNMSMLIENMIITFLKEHSKEFEKQQIEYFKKVLRSKIIRSKKETLSDLYFFKNCDDQLLRLNKYDLAITGKVNMKKVRMQINEFKKLYDVQPEKIQEINKDYMERLLSFKEDEKLVTHYIKNRTLFLTTTIGKAIMQKNIK